MRRKSSQRVCSGRSVDWEMEEEDVVVVVGLRACLWIRKYVHWTRGSGLAEVLRSLGLVVVVDDGGEVGVGMRIAWTRQSE